MPPAPLNKPARDPKKGIRERTDALLHRLYDYHGPAVRPREVTGQIWLALSEIPVSTTASYILERYHVDQMPPGWPSPNECVTAATIQGMNMIQDILTTRLGIEPIPHADLKGWTAIFDAKGPRNWIVRPPAGVPVFGGMLLPQQAARVLRVHARWLRSRIGRAYRVVFAAHKTAEDLIASLRNGHPTALHISQPINLADRDGLSLPALFGGLPHTVTLAGYDAEADTWFMLDPGLRRAYRQLSTPQLMDLWGRRFLFYPPRFSLTTLIPDAA